MTSRLAIVNLDFESIKPSVLFKMFESMIGSGVLKISLFKTSKCEQYAIVEFRNKTYAKEAYEAMDGVTIEATENILDLSFVPDDFEYDSLLEECDNSRDSRDYMKIHTRSRIHEDMIQLSEEVDLSVFIPDEFRSVPIEAEADQNDRKLQEVKLNEKNNSSENDIKDDGNNTNMGSNVFDGLKKQKEGDDLDGFEFNVKDERFRGLFENDDFAIDASNRKSKQQQASRIIIEEKQRRLVG